jgi:hypothetical protein
MIPRASLLALCVLWTAYESKFSLGFFLNTVQASVIDMKLGLDDLMHRELAPGWQTASVAE